MTLKLDVASLQEILEFNRSAIDINIPMKVEFKIHFMAKRREILKNFESQANGMLMLLNTITSFEEDPDLAQYKLLITEYGKWVATEITKLDELGQ